MNPHISHARVIPEHKHSYLVSTVQTEGIGQHIIDRREESHGHVKITFALTVAVAGVRVTPTGAARQFVRVAVVVKR